MKKMNIPDGAIRNKMIQDGLSPEEMNSFFAGFEETLASPSNKRNSLSRKSLSRVLAVKANNDTPPAKEESNNSNLDLYQKMKNAGVPDIAIRKKMSTDGITASVIDEFMGTSGSTGNVTKPVDSTPKRNSLSRKSIGRVLGVKDTAASVTTPTSSTPSAEVVPEKYMKYQKMRDMRIPTDAVKHKMRADNISEFEISTFFGEKLTNDLLRMSLPMNAARRRSVTMNDIDLPVEVPVKPAEEVVNKRNSLSRKSLSRVLSARARTESADSTIPAVVTHSPPPPVSTDSNDAVDDPLEKYRKMKESKIPQNFIRKKMTADGFSEQKIDEFFGKTVVAEAAPTETKRNSLSRKSIGRVLGANKVSYASAKPPPPPTSLHSIMQVFGKFQEKMGVPSDEIEPPAPPPEPKSDAPPNPISALRAIKAAGVKPNFVIAKPPPPPPTHVPVEGPKVVKIDAVYSLFNPLADEYEEDSNPSEDEPEPVQEAVLASSSTSSVPFGGVPLPKPKPVPTDPIAKFFEDERAASDIMSLLSQYPSPYYTIAEGEQLKAPTSVAVPIVRFQHSKSRSGSVVESAPKRLSEVSLSAVAAQQSIAGVPINRKHSTGSVGSKAHRVATNSVVASVTSGAETDHETRVVDSDDDSDYSDYVNRQTLVMDRETFMSSNDYLSLSNEAMLFENEGESSIEVSEQDEYGDEVALDQLNVQALEEYPDDDISEYFISPDVQDNVFSVTKLHQLPQDMQMRRELKHQSDEKEYENLIYQLVATSMDLNPNDHSIKRLVNGPGANRRGSVCKPGLVRSGRRMSMSMQMEEKIKEAQFKIQEQEKSGKIDAKKRQSCYQMPFAGSSSRYLLSDGSNTPSKASAPLKKDRAEELYGMMKGIHDVQKSFLEHGVKSQVDESPNNGEAEQTSLSPTLNQVMDITTTNTVNNVKTLKYIETHLGAIYDKSQNNNANFIWKSAGKNSRVESTANSTSFVRKRDWAEKRGLWVLHNEFGDVYTKKGTWEGLVAGGKGAKRRAGRQAAGYGK